MGGYGEDQRDSDIHWISTLGVGAFDLALIVLVAASEFIKYGSNERGTTKTWPANQNFPKRFGPEPGELF